MSLTAAARNQAANAIIATTISLHSAAPGAAGTANELSGGGYARGAITFGTAVDGVRSQSADVLVSVPAGAVVSHYVLWEGTTAKKIAAFTATETYVGAGQHRITGGSITITG
jgi:hypothetical protein